MYLSPRFSGIVFGACNTFGNLLGGFNPLITGAVTNGENTRVLYRIVMAATSGMLIVYSILYHIFAKADVRTWDTGEENSEETTNLLENE